MQNIVKRPENCFISPFLNDADHQTRNISTITGQTEFKETAHLGNERSSFDIIQNMKKAKKIRGLQIIQKRLNNFMGERTPMVGANVRRTTPSKSRSRSASKSKSKERSKSNKSKYSMYKPYSACRTASAISLGKSINISAKKISSQKSRTITKTRSISRS